MNGERWRNWSGSVECVPRRFAKPASEDEIVRLVLTSAAEDLPIRVVGTGHSYSPLVATTGTLVSLDKFNGIRTIDPAAAQATIASGTKLHQLGEPLRRRKLALQNQGDVDYQALAGAVSTGTHGTGIQLGSLSTQVEAFRLVKADGSVVECSRSQSPELFRAALVSFGTLGIITQLQVQLRRAYRLRNIRWNMDLEEALAAMDQLNAAHRHVEMWWFPYADRAAVRTMDPTDEPPRYSEVGRLFDEIVAENAGMWLLGQLTRIAPRLSRRAARFAARLASERDYIDHSYRVFATKRWTRANEMEYAVAAANGPDCVREIRDCVRQERLAVFFPIEYRYVAADDIPLSPFFQRESAVLSVHQFAPVPYHEYFSAAERIFVRYAGRPHWGKLHNQTAASLRPLYPEWDQFQMIRRLMDPEGKFMTPYLRVVLGD